MKEQDVFRTKSNRHAGCSREGRAGDVAGDEAAKERSGQMAKEEIGRITVHSTPFVISRSGRRTGQVSWGPRVLILSLCPRSVGSHV